ncbi:ImmA/IrrE family metallo-endopeptidase [Sphingopyxis terrae]|uniref:ImmA/IrrE family metallo-endopeptidase n=1 Tax=Sphingopyxis terrae TaxID=33052 RepID=UPI002A142E39|nr:ImmA/IrrE family metallo-endopeptidase [Sphingopyxis terrae]MDX8358571.1 ImmA/IrrE family metallo-endopeptidase [Sphingopyxis terrae]
MMTTADLQPLQREVIQRHQREAPIKLGALATELGVTVLRSDLPPGISGTLSRNAPNSDMWTIRVNRHEPKVRQRFTIAHELAHFLLHRDQIKDGITDDTFYRSGLSERREWEANRLAAEILMPWHLVRALVNEGKVNPKDLASALEVSEAAMNIRLGNPT